MKKFIIIALAALLVLGGAVAYAAVDEDGNFTNPFSNILSQKVEDGTFTQEEVDAFNKVYDGIRGEVQLRQRNRVNRIGQCISEQLDPEVVAEVNEAVKTKSLEILNSLVEQGVVDQERADLMISNWENRPGMGLRAAMFARNFDSENANAVLEAKEELAEYINGVIDQLIEEGKITEEQAQWFDRETRPMNPNMGRGMGRGNSFKGGQRAGRGSCF